MFCSLRSQQPALHFVAMSTKKSNCHVSLLLTKIVVQGKIRITPGESDVRAKRQAASSADFILIPVEQYGSTR
jgi:hypothetical protein